jgi:hypothetical protein
LSIPEDTYQYSFLAQCLEFYNDIDVIARLIEPTDESPFNSLIVRLDDIGSNNSAVNLEISFIPGLLEAAQEGVYLLQTFVELAPTVPEERITQLLFTITEINTTLPIGAFGMFPNGGALYYKHNTMLHRSWLTEDHPAVRLDQQNGIILHQLHLYIDQLL